MNNILEWILQMGGHNLAWLNVPTIPALCAGYFGVLCMYMRYKSYAIDKLDIICGMRGIICGIVILVIVLIHLSLYVQWTPVYMNYISGIQGRYFIPLLLPIYLLANNHKMNNEERIGVNVLSVVYATNLCCCICLFFSCWK